MINSQTSILENLQKLKVSKEVQEFIFQIINYYKNNIKKLQEIIVQKQTQIEKVYQLKINYEKAISNLKHKIERLQQKNKELLKENFEIQNQRNNLQVLNKSLKCDLSNKEFQINVNEDNLKNSNNKLDLLERQYQLLLDQTYNEEEKSKNHKNFQEQDLMQEILQLKKQLKNYQKNIHDEKEFKFDKTIDLKDTYYKPKSVSPLKRYLKRSIRKSNQIINERVHNQTRRKIFQESKSNIWNVKNDSISQENQLGNEDLQEYLTFLQNKENELYKKLNRNQTNAKESRVSLQKSIALVNQEIQKIILHLKRNKQFIVVKFNLKINTCQQQMQIEKEDNDIDHNLYSRQIGAFGVETMAKLVKMKVLIVGLSGLGLETAKNLILSGPKQVTLWDNRTCTQRDFEYNYYLKQQHVDNKMNRVDAILSDLKELNSYVEVNSLNLQSFESLIQQEVVQEFDLVIVTDLYPLQQVYQLNKILKDQNKALIVSGCVGLLGYCFDDFGKQHMVFDKNGEPVKQVLITSIDESGVVTTDEKQRHDLEDGDLVQFQEVVGMEQLNDQTLKIEKVISPFSFKVDLSQFQNMNSYVRNGYIKEVKQRIPMDFEIFEEYLEKPHMDMMDCDMNFENMDRVYQLKLILKVLWRFVDNVGLPELYDDSQFAAFKDLLKTELEIEIQKYEEHLSTENEKVDKKNWMEILDSDLVYLIYNLSSGHYPAITSFFGGIVAQEAVKKTGKFTPLNQMFVHEFYTHLFKNRKEQFQQLKTDAQNNVNSRYRSQVALLGENLFNQFRKQKVLMVGSGALGCEYLKMFAMTGLSCDKEGLFTVVDDDQIEVSNLNRQFLFRQKHVGNSKSKVACEVTRTFNNDFNNTSVENRMQPQTENVFHDEFWDGLNFIVNAVDNIKARQYVDSKAVFHDKALFESGTLGTKCNSQLILPKLTEAYSDSQDPPEKTVPMCTMRSFPYLIDHCIEWARTKFYEIFVNPSVFLHEFFENPEQAQQDIQKKMKTDMVELKTLTEFLSYYQNILAKPTIEEFVKVALQLYQEYFDAQIAELITLFPPDYVDKEGKLFWTSPKRPPVPLQFDKDNVDHQNFLLTTIKILNSIVPIQEEVSDSIVLNYLKDYKVTRRKPQSKTANRDDLTNENDQQNNNASSEDEQNILNMVNQLLNIASKKKDVVVNEVEFEKDDDSNGHIDFISFYSNFRAMNYSIQPAPRFQIKLKAGKIIPAIATSTAMVCGAVAIEIYKYMLQVDFESYRNFFSTLALPMFNFSEPNPPLVQRDKDYDVVLMGPVKTIPKNFNTWDKIQIKGPMTLQQMNDAIKEKYNFNVSSVVCGDMQVWSSFMPKDQHRLKMNIEDILDNIGKKKMENQRYIAFFVSGEDDDDVDISCPVVKYEF